MKIADLSTGFAMGDSLLRFAVCAARRIPHSELTHYRRKGVTSCLDCAMIENTRRHILYEKEWVPADVLRNYPLILRKRYAIVLAN
jgi:hypothetical protein